MKKIFANILLLIAVLSITGCQQRTVQTDQPVQTNGKMVKTYTEAETLNHATVKDCWLIIDGKVYDVTSYIEMHPGQDTILEGCGIDATTLFETKPMGSGTPHSEKARQILEEYYIGEVE